MEETTYDNGVDYRKMYHRLAGAVESAIRILVAAQQECEDILLDSESSAQIDDPNTAPQFITIRRNM